jgi:PAS domain S-box-containing protein
MIHVLHVDDDPTILEISKQILIDMGNFEIDHACCVNEAFKKLSTEQYDVVISDYEMPKKDGLQFLKELRDGKNDIPFILFTGKGREEIVIQALNLGADHYVNKQGSPEAVYRELAHLVSSAIEKSRAKLRIENDSLALHNVHDAIVSADANFTIIGWNKAAEESYGFSFLEVIQQNIEDVFKKIQISPPLEEIIGKLKTTGQFQGEVFYKNKNGQKRNAELKISSIVSKNGKFLGTVSVCSDITERKKSKELLAESDTKYLRLFNTSEVGMFRTKLHSSEILDINMKLLQILGYTREEMQCKPATFYYADNAQRQEIVKILQTKGQVVDFEIELVTKQGLIKTCSLSSKLYPEQQTIEGSIIDVTERKKAERALAESEEKYKKLFENAPDAIVTTDMTGRITSANKAIFQFGFSEKDLVEKSLLALVPSEYTQKMLKGLKNMAAGNSYQNEIEIITPIGKRSIEYNSTPTWLDGKVVGYQTIIRDITQRKKIEHALIESEKNYRNLIDAMNDAVWVIDYEGHFVDFNDAFVRSLGYSKEQLLSLGIESIDNSKNHEISKMILAQLIQNGHHVFETMYTTKDGQKIPVEISSSLTTYNGKQAVLNIARNITERKKAEQVLKQSEERFYKVFNDSPVAMMISRISDGVMVDVNEACLKMLGNSREEVIGSKTTDLRIIINDASRKEIWAFLQKDGMVRDKELTVTTKTGKSIRGIVSVDKITVNNQAYVIITFVDITALKMVEEKLKEDQTKLEIFNEKLQVVGGLTRHDVKNKHSVIKANSYLLKKQIGNHPELLKNLEGIDLAVNQSEAIFEFSRLYEKIGVEKPSCIDVAESFQQATKLHPEASKISILNDCVGLRVLADSMLRQLFYNLIDNSLRHGKKATQIKLSYTQSEEETSLFFEDNGVGVPNENKDKIFSEGFTTGGSGLGLKLVKKMIEAYGWCIKENGVPDEGARFEITIPK